MKKHHWVIFFTSRQSNGSKNANQQCFITTFTHYHLYFVSLGKGIPPFWKLNSFWFILIESNPIKSNFIYVALFIPENGTQRAWQKNENMKHKCTNWTESVLGMEPDCNWKFRLDVNPAIDSLLPLCRNGIYMCILAEFAPPFINRNILKV